MTSGRVQKVYDEGLRPSVASAFKQRRTETALGSARLDRSVRDRWKKILNHRLPFARNKHQAVLRRIDDLVAIAEQAADQRHIIVNLPGACDDLRRTAIDIHDVVAFARSTHRLSIFQLELLQSGPLLDHSAVTGMAALGGKAEDGDGGMSVKVCLLFANSRLGFLIESRNVLLSEVRGVQAAEVFWGNSIAIQELKGCIHFKLLILGRVFRNNAADANSVTTLTAGSKRRFRSFSRRNNPFPTKGSVHGGHVDESTLSPADSTNSTTTAPHTPDTAAIPQPSPTTAEPSPARPPMPPTH